jgi:hypothetical protein
MELLPDVVTLDDSPRPLRARAPSAGDDDREPRWIAGLLIRTGEDFVRFFGTLLRFTFTPGRFAEQWRAGVGRPFHPLAAMATSATVLTTAQTLCFQYAGFKNNASFLNGLAWSLSPYAYLAALAILCHLFLWLGGGVRRVESSVAFALYAGAGPLTLGMLVTLGVSAYGIYVGAYTPNSGGIIPGLQPELRRLVVIACYGSLIGFTVPFWRSMSRLHERSGLRTLLTLLVAVGLLGVAAGKTNLSIPRFEYHVGHVTVGGVRVPFLWPNFRW